MADEEEDGTAGDARLAVIEQFTIKTLKQKTDKWAKMTSQEENMVMLTEFMEKADNRLLVIQLLPSGQLSPMDTFPASTKNKAVYFIKKSAEQLKKDNLKEILLLGDLSSLPLDQLSSIVDAVSTNII